MLGRERGGTGPRLNAELRDGEAVKPLELFFDLVFVLGFTQCTTLMGAQGSWKGLAQGLLALAVLWWSWVGYAWLTSVIDPEEGAVRLVMLAATAGLLIVALCVPEAFDDRALTFAVAYAVVRAAHIALFVIASRGDGGLRRSVTFLGLSTVGASGLLFVAAALDGPAQGAAWVLALLVDFGGPALAGEEGWHLVPGHFAERHGLVVILALGESIVALGGGAQVHLSVGVIAAAVLGVALAGALWWTYFDVVSLVTARRLAAAEPGREQNRLARDSYSYLHFPMVAGIILSALGVEETVAHVDGPLDMPHAVALLGGVALYLLAHVALRLRNARTLNRQRLALAVVLLALLPVARHVDAAFVLAGVDALIWAMITYETSTYDHRRYALRHGMDPGALPGAQAPPAGPDDEEAPPEGEEGFRLDDEDLQGAQPAGGDDRGASADGR